MSKYQIFWIIKKLANVVETVKCVLYLLKWINLLNLCDNLNRIVGRIDGSFSQITSYKTVFIMFNDKSILMIKF